MGARIVAAGDRWMGFLRLSRSCEAFERCEVLNSDPEALARRVNDLVRRHRIDLVMAGDHDSEWSLVRARPRIEAPVFAMPTVVGLAQFTDKRRFYDACEDIGIPVPRSVFASRKQDLAPERLAVTPGYPLIVKPTNWGGSTGVVLVSSPQELRRKVLEEASYVYEPLVAQAFVPGIDVSYNVMGLDGVAYQASVHTREGNEIRFLDHPSILALGERFVAATGLNGVACLDARVAPDGRIAFLECNARIWSSICNACWCGTNYVETGVRHALGQPLPPEMPLAGRSVASPAHLLRRILTGRRAPWRLTRPERHALAQGLADPVLLFRRYFERLRGDRHQKPDSTLVDLPYEPARPPALRSAGAIQ